MSADAASCGHRRLFFALWPDPAGRDALAAATTTARSAPCAGSRPVPQDQWHLTLLFLGAVNAARLAALQAAAAAIRARPVPITLDALEYWAVPRVLCASSRAGSAAATALAAGVREAALAMGLAPDLKPFRPHVTLQRKVVRAPSALVMNRVALSFAEFALVESRSDRAGPIYSIVSRWRLYETGSATQNP